MKFLLSLCVVFLAGCISGNAQTAVDTSEGGTFILNLQTLPDNVTKCYLVNPAKVSIDLDENSDDRYELRLGNPVFGCSINVSGASADDSGTWTIRSVADDGKERSADILVTVILSSDEEEEDEFDYENAFLYPGVNYPARRGSFVSVGLSKADRDEECFLRSPRNINTPLSTIAEGVEAFGPSHITTCRVRIGPMDANMLGVWNLCAKYIENEIKHVRCQPANITWVNNSPDLNWTPKVQNDIDYVVNYNMMLTPNIRSSATIRTCHVVTPDGTDVAVEPDSDFPGVRRVLAGTSACRIEIGPIDAGFIGDWEVYATFSSFFEVIEEIRQPIHLYLYDKENPYNQAYNRSELLSTSRVVNLGTNQVFLVSPGNSGSTDDCTIIAPTGEIYDSRYADEAHEIVLSELMPGCQVSIGPISDKLLGEYRVTGKFRTNDIFREISQTFTIKLEDPYNPTPDEGREIRNQASQYFDTKMGATHRVSLSTDWSFSTHESCHILAPDGRQYQLMAGFNVPGMEIIEGNVCGVNVTLTTEDVIGDWVLISRDTELSTRIERRVPFTVYVEEFVDATPSVVTVSEGANLHIRLANPTNLHESCQLKGPDGHDPDIYEIDYNFIESCGYIIPNVHLSDAGKWEILYGPKIIYRAPIEVNITDRWTSKEKNLVWAKDRNVNITLGPEEAVFCSIQDPQGSTVFESFSQCTINVERVTRDHNGVWKMVVGMPGRILTEESEFYVHVNEAASKALVTTHVAKERPVVTLSCSVSSDYEVRRCKFRDPSGRVLLAGEGLGEDRYVFHGKGVSIKSEMHSHDCGLKISDPATSDLGLWRCAMETSQDTYFGHLTVLCPWDMSDPAVAALVVSEPVLSAEVERVEVVEGDGAVLRCSVQAAIRYCYFRRQNGTVFSVGPGVSDSYEYAGAGFDSGECAIRFPRLMTSDAGRWSCHVGFLDPATPEQRADLQIDIEELMVATQYRTGSNLIVKGQVYAQRGVDYCRFVRIDGFGFTSENVPDRYTSSSVLSSGLCRLTIIEPTIIDDHPWTVVVRIAGQDVEVSRVTEHSIDFPEVPEEEVTPPTVIIRTGRYPFLWILLTVLSLTLLLMIALGPRKHRDWSYSRALVIRESFRKSFRIHENNKSKSFNSPIPEKNPAILA